MNSLLRIICVFGLLAMVSCNEEPKLEQQEEQAVEQQLNLDQKSMDSLEAAIMSQMDALESDSAIKDSAE